MRLAFSEAHFGGRVDGGRDLVHVVAEGVEACVEGAVGIMLRRLCIGHVEGQRWRLGVEDGRRCRAGGGELERREGARDRGGEGHGVER